MFHRVPCRECSRSPETGSIFEAFRIVVHKNELSRLRTAKDKVNCFCIMAWYISKGNEREGPVNGDRLRSMIITGEISSTDLVAWGEQGEWIAAGEVSDFSGPDPVRTETSSTTAASAPSNPEEEVSLAKLEERSEEAPPVAPPPSGADVLASPAADKPDEPPALVGRENKRDSENEDKAERVVPKPSLGGADSFKPPTVGKPVEEAPARTAKLTGEGEEISNDSDTSPPLSEGDQTSGISAQDATLNDRILATLIDMLVAIGVGWMINLFIGGPVWLYGSLCMLLRESLPVLNGQSIGKRAMKLQTVTLDGKVLKGDWDGSMLNGNMLRNVVFLIPLFPMVELIVLSTRASQHHGIGGLCRQCACEIERKPEFKPLLRLGDQWAGTKVISLSSRPEVGGSAE